MKKKQGVVYLAKMLPVFGDIKEGDLIKHKPSGKIHEVKYDSTILAGKSKGWIKRYQKVALFLVSREIQKGDWVYHSEGSFGAVDTQRNGLYQVRYYKTFISDALPEDLWCIYGMISPAAKWVKDGDVIDHSMLGTPKEKLIENPYDTSPVNTFTEIYPIKCPCCDIFK